MAFAIRKRLTDLVAHSAPAREDIHVSHLAVPHPEARLSGCSLSLGVSSGPGFVRPPLLARMPPVGATPAAGPALEVRQG